MQNWFPTLNAALDSEILTGLWPTGVNLAYGQTVGLASGGRWISVYRDEQGLHVHLYFLLAGRRARHE